MKYTPHDPHGDGHARRQAPITRRAPAGLPDRTIATAGSSGASGPSRLGPRGASTRRRDRQAGPIVVVVAVVLIEAALAPRAAVAHGLSQPSDLPIPVWLVGWAACAVLVVSFVGLSLLWRTPRLAVEHWRPLPRPACLLLSKPAQILAGAAGTGVLMLIIWSGLAGVQNATANFAPTAVYVGFWVGMVLVSVVFGDVFRAVNPWRAVARACGWAVARAGFEMPEPQRYPRCLGRWPAVLALIAFGWLELVYAEADQPATVAWAVLAYSAYTWTSMALFGVDRWVERGEAFSVYFSIFAAFSPLKARDGTLGLRRPLSGLAALRGDGMATFVCATIALTTFDGAGSLTIWQDISDQAASVLQDVGLAATPAFHVVDTAGLAVTVLAIVGLYRFGVRGARGAQTRRARRPKGLGDQLAHTLAPVALAYIVAHYASSVIFQGPALLALASDPLGHGWDLLGTATVAVDSDVLDATALWWLQIAAVVGGHVAGLALAHDRALVLYRDTARAARSQYWMLAVMVALTSLALLLLSQGNA